MKVNWIPMLVLFWRFRVQIPSQRLSILADNFVTFHSPPQDNYIIIPQIANDSVNSSIIIPFDLIFSEHLTVISLSRPVFHKKEILQTSMVWSPCYVIAALMLPIYEDSISKNRHVM